MPSDSNYRAVARHTRRPVSSSSSGKGGGAAAAAAAAGASSAPRRVVLDVVDETWATDTLSDDEIEIARHEAAVAPLLEEGELDADAIVVSPTGNSAASAANNAAERRRREEGWNDLGLDQIDANGRGMASVPTRMPSQHQE